ncbi:MAG: hypothetical protein KME42_13510 [Tildeniella nuda ZEHNDER 1965/U140]|nr:hypothetical protein [Tildeniella nuda ZEHNDER 1965/U140]
MWVPQSNLEYKLSAVSGQRSAISGQLSAVSYQRLAVSGWRSAVSYQRSAIVILLELCRSFGLDNSPLHKADG